LSLSFRVSYRNFVGSSLPCVCYTLHSSHPPWLNNTHKYVLYINDSSLEGRQEMPPAWRFCMNHDSVFLCEFTKWLQTSPQDNALLKRIHIRRVLEIVFARRSARRAIASTTCTLEDQTANQYLDGTASYCSYQVMLSKLLARQTDTGRPGWGFVKGSSAAWSKQPLLRNTNIRPILSVSPQVMWLDK
jgi:hypothetical protein